MDIGKEKCYSARHLARFAKELSTDFLPKSLPWMQRVPKESNRKRYVKKSGSPAGGMVKKFENKNILHKTGTCSKKKKEQVGRRTHWNLKTFLC